MEEFSRRDVMAGAAVAAVLFPGQAWAVDPAIAAATVAARQNAPVISDHADVLRFLALPTRCDVELDALTFVEALVAVALDVGEVHENVVALFARDESETLRGIEELHGSDGH